MAGWDYWRKTAWVGVQGHLGGGGEGVETVDCSEVRNQNVREDIK